MQMVRRAADCELACLIKRGYMVEVPSPPSIDVELGIIDVEPAKGRRWPRSEAHLSRYFVRAF